MMSSLRKLVCTLVVVFLTHESCWALVGDTCTNSCENGMVCSNSKCACPSDSVETPDKARCLPVMKHVGGGCELQAQCTKGLSNYAQCVDFKCACKENAVVVNNVCERKRDLNDACVSNEQCQHITGASCRSGVCACNDQFVPHPTARTICLPIAVNFQSRCEEDIQCSNPLGDKAFCRDSRCQCAEGYHSSQSYQPKCIESKGLKETCTPGQCYLPMDQDNQNIDCIENICTCKNDVKPSHDDQSCSGSSGLQSLGVLTAVWFVALGMSRNLL